MTVIMKNLERDMEKMAVMTPPEFGHCCLFTVLCTLDDIKKVDMQKVFRETHIASAVL